jgi:hypothetical protein
VAKVRYSKVRNTIALYVLAAFALAGCGDECREYSEFSCSQLEKASYNVYFYYPDGKELYMGLSQSLSGCRSLAYSFAVSQKMGGNKDWSYICCMQAKGSECYEKHR